MIAKRSSVNRWDKTVLVISDVKERFGQTASILMQDGHQVLFQRKFRGTDQFRQRPPSLLICELAALDIDGPTICRQVRDDLGQRRTRVLLVGDLSIRSSIVVESLECGATNYLQKPVDSVLMAQVCRKILKTAENSDSSDLSHYLGPFLAGDIRDLKWEIRKDLMSTN